MNARNARRPCFQDHERRVVTVRDGRVATGTGRDFREILGCHARVHRVVIGTFATVSLDFESPLAAVPEYLEQDMQHLERGGSRGRRRVDDELLRVVLCAPAERVPVGVQGLPLRWTDVSNRTRAAFTRTDFRQHAFARLGPELHV